MNQQLTIVVVAVILATLIQHGLGQEDTPAPVTSKPLTFATDPDVTTTPTPTPNPTVTDVAVTTATPTVTEEVTTASPTVTEEVTTLTPTPTTVAVTTTHGPSHAIDFNFGENPHIENLTITLAYYEKEIYALDREFLGEYESRNQGKLETMLARINAVREEVGQLRTTIQSDLDELDNEPPTHFYSRLLLNLLLIQAQKFDKVLKSIGLEIVGDFEQVSRFEFYSISDSLTIELGVLRTKVAAIMENAYEAEKALAEVPADGSVSQQVKNAANSHLQAVQQNAANIKGQFSYDYYGELERIRALADNRELNLLQRMQFEGFIDMLNFLTTFVRKYQEQLNRMQ